MARRIPRPFALPWGAGEILEEVSVVAGVNGHTWEPTIQLLAYAEGGESVRFCYYDARGRFGRGPMLLRPEDVPPLRAALEAAPRLQFLLRGLLG